MLLTRAPGNKSAPNSEQGLKKPRKKRVWDGETHTYTHRVKWWGILCMPESCTSTAGGIFMKRFQDYKDRYSEYKTL